MFYHVRSRAIRKVRLVFRSCETVEVLSPLKRNTLACVKIEHASFALAMMFIPKDARVCISKIAMDVEISCYYGLNMSRPLTVVLHS